jgi:hypothetical protein
MRWITAGTIVVFTLSHAAAQEFATATQVVTLEVRSITSLSVSGDPGPMVISSFEPGASRSSIVDNSTRYSVTSNNSTVRVSLSIDRPMPAGSRLLAHFETESGLSNGNVDISDASSPVVAVSGIQRGREADNRIRYTFEADADSGPIPSQQRTITLTLTD